MRIAVTGAAGLTGGAVVRELAGRGHDVVAIVRRPVAVPTAHTVVRADVRDGASMDRAFAEAEALIHVAGIHLGEHLAAIPALRTLRRVVVVSTASVYSAHRASATVYERNEAALREARSDALFVRPTMIYGSARDRNVHRIVAFARRWRFMPVPGQGSALIQPIHYADLAQALATLTERDDAGVLDAGGGLPISLADAARTILRELGQPERIVRVPLVSARAAATLIDLVGRGHRWRERVERTLEDRSVDNARLVAATGISPRDFPTGVRDMLGGST